MNNEHTATSNSEAVSFSNAESLFMEQLEGDMITSDAEVTQLLWVIEEAKTEIESLKQTKREHKEFYDRKIASVQENIDYLTQRIELYLKSKGADKLATPNGTAFFTKRKKAVYPDDEVLLDYAKRHGLDYKTKEKPLKTPIKEFIEQGGEPPEGFSYEVEESLQIRRAQ